MQFETRSGPRYSVRIDRHGAEAFAWEISRKADSIVIHRSTRLFVTRIEAIFDSASAAATLNVAAIGTSIGDGGNRNGD
jgi:hypothetical protein